MNHCGCKNCCAQPCAGKVPIFSMLDATELSQVSELIIHREYEKGAFLIMEGERLKSLYIISQGQVKAFKNSSEGKEQILYIFSQGDFFGEKNLLSNQDATYTIEALEDTKICMIIQQDFRNLMLMYPHIGIKVMESLSERLEKLERAIENMGTKSVESRICAVLLEFSEKFGKEERDGILIELPLSREGIAHYIGLTRETVSRKLSSFQDEGLIEMIGNKKILIKDKQAIARAYDEPFMI